MQIRVELQGPDASMLILMEKSTNPLNHCLIEDHWGYIMPGTRVAQRSSCDKINSLENKPVKKKWKNGLQAEKKHEVRHQKKLSPDRISQYWVGCLDGS